MRRSDLVDRIVEQLRQRGRIIAVEGAYQGLLPTLGNFLAK
jgi:hypothetical protein